MGYEGTKIMESVNLIPSQQTWTAELLRGPWKQLTAQSYIVGAGRMAGLRSILGRLGNHWNSSWVKGMFVSLPQVSPNSPMGLLWSALVKLLVQIWAGWIGANLPRDGGKTVA